MNRNQRLRVTGLATALALMGTLAYARLECAKPALPTTASTNAPAQSALNGHSVGIYGINPWRNGVDDPKDPSFFTRVSKADFCLKRIRINSTTDPKITQQMVDSVNADLRAAEQLSPMRHEIVMLDFWDNGDHYRLSPGLQDYSVYRERVMNILSRISTSSPALIGITLSEENVASSNNRDDYLTRLYHDAKAQYPSLQVYQWFMGPITGGVFTPGDIMPDNGPLASIPADGYVIDTYELAPHLYPDSRFHFGNDPYDALVQRYLATGKPLISVVWASSEAPGSRTEGLFQPDNPRNMFAIMDHQVSVNIRRGVPTMFYWIEDVPRLKSKVPYFGDNGKYPFSNDDDPLIPQINSYVKKEMVRIKGG